MLLHCQITVMSNANITTYLLINRHNTNRYRRVKVQKITKVAVNTTVLDLSADIHNQKHIACISIK